MPDLVEMQKKFGLSEGAAKWWDHLADVEAVSYHSTNANRNQARLYRRAAEAIRIKIKTGIAVCACCHKPLGEGMRF